MGTELVWASALVTGVAVWSLQRKRRRWRTLFDEAPGGMTTEQHQRRQDRRYQLRRLLISVACAGFMACAAVAFDIFFAS